MTFPDVDIEHLEDDVTFARDRLEREQAATTEILFDVQEANLQVTRSQARLEHQNREQQRAQRDYERAQRALELGRGLQHRPS